MTPFRRFPSFLLCALTALTLVACGGGSNSGTDTDNDTTNKLVEQRVHGSIDQDGVDNTPVSVEILSYKPDGSQVDNETTLASSTGQGDWVYDTRVQMAESGGYLVVNMEKEGYAGFSRKIVFESAQDTQVMGRVVQAAEAQVTLEDNGYVLRSGRTRSSFTFALVEDARGQRSLVSGAERLRMARSANATDLLVIDIPESSVPADVTALQGRLASFDPNDVEESESFPGEYADSDGNELLSVAFQFNEITTADGQSLGKAVQQARARGLMPRAPSEPTIISRYIPPGSCSAMENLGDADANKTGFQIPIYTYNPNTGLWELLGTGTVYYDDGTAVASTETVFDCTLDSFYLEIEVSNEDFNRKWWNLDYPLVFDEPVQLCAKVEIEDQDGVAMGGNYVFLKDDDGRSFSDTYGFTDSQGRVTLTTTLIDGSDDRTANIRYWGFDNASYQSSEVTLSNQCNDVQTVTVTRLDKCLIEGRILDGTTPAVGTFVYALGESNGDSADDWHYGYGETDANGSYRFNAVCNMDYELYAGGYVFGAGTKSVNVNTSLGEDEQSDNGTKVVMKDIVIENQPPFAFAYFNWNDYPDSFETFEVDGVDVLHYGLDSGTVDVMVLAWDWDDNWPITLELQLIDSNGTVRDTVTRSLNEEEGLNSDDDLIITMDVPVNGFYRLGGTITDSEGASTGINDYEQDAQ